MKEYIFKVKNFIIIMGFILFATPVVAFAQTTGAAQGISGGTALNWAGYVSDTGTYTSISGSWVVPTVTDISANGADATWIGIGGVLSHDLIQTGTEAVPDTDGGIDYQAWYELLPSGSVTVPLSVHAGDSMNAMITKESNTNTWLITLIDTTTGKSYSTTVNYTSSLSSAEWIEEMPAGVGTSISLDDFGTIGFTKGSTVMNGTSVSIAGSDAQALTMANAENQPLAVPSILGADGASFSVTRTDAASSAIGIGGSIGGFGRTFVTNSSSTSAGGYSTSSGYAGIGTTTSVTPTITVSYGYGSYNTIRPRYRMARSYSIVNDNGVISLVINDFSMF
jgi:hypothetical protein